MSYLSKWLEIWLNYKRFVQLKKIQQWRCVADKYKEQNVVGRCRIQFEIFCSMYERLSRSVPIHTCVSHSHLKTYIVLLFGVHQHSDVQHLWLRMSVFGFALVLRGREWFSLSCYRHLDVNASDVFFEICFVSKDWFFCIFAYLFIF